MLETFNTFVVYSSSLETVNQLRTFNVIIGVLASIVLLRYVVLPNWHAWDVPTRLGWMALIMLALTSAYVSLEAAYLSTFFRVPMITVSLVWAILAALWPKDKGSFWSNKESK